MLHGCRQVVGRDRSGPLMCTLQAPRWWWFPSSSCPSLAPLRATSSPQDRWASNQNLTKWPFGFFGYICDALLGGKNCNSVKILLFIEELQFGKVCLCCTFIRDSSNLFVLDFYLFPSKLIVTLSTLQTVSNYLVNQDINSLLLGVSAVVNFDL